MTLTVPAVTPDCAPDTVVPRAEYPRPHFDRSARWSTLNGEWSFRRGAASDGGPAADWA